MWKQKLKLFIGIFNDRAIAILFFIIELSRHNSQLLLACEYALHLLEFCNNKKKKNSFVLYQWTNDCQTHYAQLTCLLFLLVLPLLLLLLLWLLLLLLFGTCWFCFKRFASFKCGGTKSLFVDGLYGESRFDASSLDVALESVILNVATPLYGKMEEKTWNKKLTIEINLKLIRLTFLVFVFSYDFFDDIPNDFLHFSNHHLTLGSEEQKKKIRKRNSRYMYNNGWNKISLWFEMTPRNDHFYFHFTFQESKCFFLFQLIPIRIPL